MRCVLTTPFGVPVEPDVNRSFAIVSPRDGWRTRASTAGEYAVARSSATRAGSSTGTSSVERRERAARTQRGPRRTPRPARRSRASARSLRVILRQQRVRRRDRRDRHADVHRGEREQRVIDRVARQHHQRPRRPRPEVEQRRAECARRRERFAIRDVAPACSVALRVERALWRMLRPVRERIAETARVAAARRRATAG